MSQTLTRQVPFGEMEQEIKRLQKELQRAEATSLYYKKRGDFQRQLIAISHKKLTGDEKAMIYVLHDRYLENPRKKPDENDEYLIYKFDTVLKDGQVLPGLASFNGTSPDTSGVLLNKLTAKGLIEHRVTKPTKDHPKRRTYVRFTEKFCIEGFQALPEGQWGGNREQFKCKACGGRRCQVEEKRTITRTCMDCGVPEYATETRTYIIEPDESQDTEHYFFADEPVEPSFDEIISDGKEQAREERIEREKNLHQIGIQEQLARRGLTQNDVQFTQKSPIVPIQEEPSSSSSSMSQLPERNGHHQEPHASQEPEPQLAGQERNQSQVTTFTKVPLGQKWPSSCSNHVAHKDKWKPTLSGLHCIVCEPGYGI